MLDYDFTFKKGILFISLKGDITKETSGLISNEINPLILDNGIKKVVLNISELKNIDDEGIKELYKSYLILNRESNVSICEIPIFLRERLKFLLKHIKESEDEYTILMRN